MNDQHDCGGEPGTTQEECDAVISCLLRKIEQLQARNQEMRRVGNKLFQCASQIGWTSSGDMEWIVKAKDALFSWSELGLSDYEQLSTNSQLPTQTNVSH